MHKFMKAAFNKFFGKFVIYVATLEIPVSIITMQPQRKRLLITFKQDKAMTEILIEYNNFVDVFSPNLAIDFLDCIGINKYDIKLVKSKLSLYGPIYSISLVELETLKTYIETHLKIGFIHLFKSPVKVPIVFNIKSHKSFYLYVNYQDSNNLIIKNCYSLSPISELLDGLR